MMWSRGRRRRRRRRRRRVALVTSVAGNFSLAFHFLPRSLVELTTMIAN